MSTQNASSVIASQRFVIATLGSLGDLFPFLALGTALLQRGHQVAIATSAEYQDQIEAAGLQFRHMRPDLPEPAVYRQLMDRANGPQEVLVHVIEAIHESYADLDIAARDTDVLIASQIAFAVPLIAQRRSIPWATVVLQPMGFMSKFDPPIIPQLRTASTLFRKLGPVFGVPLSFLSRVATRTWTRPIALLRSELGLPATDDNPLFDGQLSRELVLALFPESLARKQVDWPKESLVTGAAFWDGGAAHPHRGAIARFLAEGSAPLVFTLGSAAVHTAGSFYRESFLAVERIGARAIFLIGDEPENRAQFPEELPKSVLLLDFAPHHEVFQRAAATIHQGGVGTLSQAMRAGKPMLVVPFSHDQPDNADRVRRLGIALVLDPLNYVADRVAPRLARLLTDRRMKDAASVVGEKVRRESAAAGACDAIEAWLIKRTLEGQSVA